MSADHDEVEQLAVEALRFEDAEARREEETTRQLIERLHGVDAADYQEKGEYLAAVREARSSTGGSAGAAGYDPDTGHVPDTTAEQLARRRAAGEIGDREERLAEQAGSQPSPGGGGRQDSDPDDVDAEQLARSVLGAEDVLDANEGEPPSEVLERRYGVDASEFSHEQELFAAVEPKRADGAASRGSGRRTGSGGRTLSRTVSSGGGGGGDRGGGAFESEADQLAQAVLGAEDILDANDDESPSEILERRHGLDASAFASEKELRRKKRESDGTDHGASVELR